LAGALVFPLWIVALALAIGLTAGPLAGLLALVALPVLGLFTLGLREQWTQARAEASRYLTLRRRQETVEPLREQQRELAVRLKAVLEQRAGLDHQPGGSSAA
jgi:hypothetical protein